MKLKRRVKVFPGVYLNFSNSGISTTIGVPGTSINLGQRGAYYNSGIPGTGIYSRRKINSRGNVNENEPEPYRAQYLQQNGAIQTDEAEATTTEGLQELKHTLLDCYEERQELRNEIGRTKNKLAKIITLQLISRLLIIGFFIKWFKESRRELAEELTELEEQLANCFIEIDMDVSSEIDSAFVQLLKDYRLMLGCEKIWDITSSVSVDQKSTRSAAAFSVTRRLVSFGFSNIDIIRSKYDALHFENANGGDLYIYPAFIAIVDAHRKFGLVDIRELNFSFHKQRFIEEQKVPSDSDVVGHTWAKVNKNGSPDKRFKDNYQIPVCLYGEFSMTSKTGLNEAYSLSDCNKAEKFAQSMTAYQRAIKQC